MLCIFSIGVVGPVNIFMVRVPNWAKLGSQQAVGTKITSQPPSFKLHSTRNIQVFDVQMHSVI
jgi:hypothetical protein